jgi:hypothetical protein
MQNYFSLLWPQLLRDHDFNNLILHKVTLQVDLNFLAQCLLEKILKDFPIEADVKMFYPIVAPHNSRGPWIKLATECSVMVL